MKLSKGKIAVIVVLLVLIIDQVTKIWIKTHMYLGECIPVTSWFEILFVENNGMAFGLEIISKLFLSVFRIVAVIVVGYYLFKIVSLILAGAAGNIIDCLFYGLIFNAPMPPEVAVLFPEGGGYQSLFHGRVVDMLHFPLFSFYWPDWIPWIGGNRFEFFRPIFNIADSAISVGVVVVLLFYRKYLSVPEKEKVENI